VAFHAEQRSRRRKDLRLADRHVHLEEASIDGTAFDYLTSRGPCESVTEEGYHRGPASPPDGFDVSGPAAALRLMPWCAEMIGARLATAAALLVAGAIAATAQSGGWIADASVGCRVWNPHPQPNETIR
jgi:hypothetical protein